MIKNFRGFTSHGVFRKSGFDPLWVNGKFSFVSPAVPSSFDYKLDDLLAAGVNVAPVSTEVIHDSASVDSVIDSFNNSNSDK